MFTLMRTLVWTLLILTCIVTASACGNQSTKSAELAPESTSPTSDSRYTWVRATARAEFRERYNFQLFAFGGKLWAFHPDGIWYSNDGTTWSKSSLPALKPTAYDTTYVQFKDSVYSLGDNAGDISSLRFKPTVRRTRDMATWEVLSEKSNLPGRVFGAILEFKGKIWLLGGFDGSKYYNDVWNSDDGTNWTLVSDRSEWSPRNIGGALVFKDRIWIIGGGVIDQTPLVDVWSSEDGVKWMQETKSMAAQPVFGFSAVAFDNRIWLLGINRNHTFTNGILVSSNGTDWNEMKAPWSPRGGIASCVLGDKLYMTGGKYSTGEGEQIRFVYSNDVWYITANQSISP